MKRTKVISSNLAAIGYDTANEILEIEFKNGSIYHYFEVPLYEYSGIMEAKSHGKYLAEYIKDIYRYELLN